MISEICFRITQEGKKQQGLMKKPRLGLSMVAIMALGKSRAQYTTKATFICVHIFPQQDVFKQHLETL